MSRGLSNQKGLCHDKTCNRIELSRLSVDELEGFYKNTFNQLVQSQQATCLRRNALATLDNISNELNQRHSRGSP